MKITKKQGRACLAHAEGMARDALWYPWEPKVFNAWAALGWACGAFESYFSVDPRAVHKGIDREQVILACCMAAAVAGVRP